MNPEHAMSIGDVLLTGSILIAALLAVWLYATRTEP